SRRPRAWRRLRWRREVGKMAEYARKQPADVAGRAHLLAAIIGVSAGCPAGAAPAAGTLAPHDEAADREKIQQLTIEYSYRLDHGRANDLAELFTTDAVFNNPNIPLRA